MCFVWGYKWNDWRKCDFPLYGVISARTVRVNEIDGDGEIHERGWNTECGNQFRWSFEFIWAAYGRLRWDYFASSPLAQRRRVLVTLQRAVIRPSPRRVEMTSLTATLYTGFWGCSRGVNSTRSAFCDHVLSLHKQCWSYFQKLSFPNFYYVHVV